MHIDNNDYTVIPSGQIWIHHAWSGDIASAQYYMPKGVNVDVVGYWFPPDGRGPVAQRHDHGAQRRAEPGAGPPVPQLHARLNNVLTNISFNGYMQPINGVTPQRLVKEQLLPPSLMSTVVLPSYFRRGVMQLQIPVATNALWEQAWLQAKSA